MEDKLYQPGSNKEVDNATTVAGQSSLATLDVGELTVSERIHVVEKLGDILQTVGENHLLAQVLWGNIQRMGSMRSRDDRAGHSGRAVHHSRVVVKLTGSK